MGATAGRRVAAAVGLAGAAVLAAVGCQPVDGSMDAVTVT